MDFPIRIPFVDALGLQLVRMGQGRAELSLALRPDQCNSFGVCHGGVLMTMLDVVMAHAARSKDMDLSHAHALSVVTIEMKTSFMRPGRGHLHAVGTLLHHGSKLAFCEGRVENEMGELVGHATATFKFVVRSDQSATRPGARPA